VLHGSIDLVLHRPEGVILSVDAAKLVRAHGNLSRGLFDGGFANLSDVSLELGKIDRVTSVKAGVGLDLV